MPIIKSAIKRAKQSLVRRSRNLHVKREVKRDVLALHDAIATGKPEEVQAKLGEAYSEIDRAVKKGSLHKNTAARRKSQLAHTVAKSLGAETVPAETKTTKGAGKHATAKATVKKTPAKTAAKKPGAKVVAKKAAPKTALKKPPAKADKTEK